MKRLPLVLFGTGLLLASLPGLFPAGLRLLSTVGVLLGAGSILIATVRGWGVRPPSALLLLAGSNAAFWLCYALWRVRLRFNVPSGQPGIDPFAGLLAEWVLLLALFSLYEAGVFIWGATKTEQRPHSFVGLVVLLLQCVTSVRFAYHLVQGV